MVTSVPEGECEHATEVVHAADAVVLIEVDDRLGIAGRAEDVTASHEIPAEIVEVVDLPVEDDPDRTVLVANGLIAGMQVDDAEPSHAQADPRAHVHASGVG